MLDSDKQREIVRLKLVDRLSERKISEICKCSRKSVRKYVSLFEEWRGEKNYVLKIPTGRDGAAYITNHLTDIINKGEWVIQPLQEQMIGKVIEARTQIAKARKNHKKVKVMEIFECLREGSEGLVLEEGQKISYSTIYLACKLEGKKNKQEPS